MYRTATYAEMVARQRENITGERHKIIVVDAYDHHLDRVVKKYLVAKDDPPSHS